MANFTALNIEPDDQSDDEVDNTKELQGQEAVKQYQLALKQHAQAKFPEAARAYISLFELDIFRYPESLTEFTRLEQHPELELIDPAFALEIAAAIESAPSTLPQILYQSYKNHGQFILDCVKHSLKHEPIQKTQLEYQAKVAVDNFALALASDESDAELWRRASRIGKLLGSSRISRYCLEAALELDDDPTVAEVDPPALEEAFAGEQLKQLLESLSDDTALSHPIMAPFVKKSMPKQLLKHIDPYPFLPTTTKDVEGDDMDMDEEPVQSRLKLHVESRSWTGTGFSLCEAYLSAIGQGSNAIEIVLPELAQSIEADLSDLIQSQLMEVDSANTADVRAGRSPSELARTSLPQASGVEDESPVQIVTTTTTVPLADESPQLETSLPTRKRSQSVAGIQEAADDEAGAQKRSKRIRKRDNTDSLPDPSTQFAEALQDFQTSDEQVFTFIGNLLTKIGVDDLDTFPNLQQSLALGKLEDRQDVVASTAVRDLRDILNTWDDTKASTFTNANAAELLGSTSGTANAGLTAFLEHSKSGTHKVNVIPEHADGAGVGDFVERINQGWFPLQDVIYEWMCEVLPTYTSTSWSDEMKRCVGRTVSFTDSELFTRLHYEVEEARRLDDVQSLRKLEEMCQTIVEIHLDIHARVTGPNSTVLHETRAMTKDRVERWLNATAELMRLRADAIDNQVSIRYLWSSVYYSTQSDTVSREHKVSCWTEVQEYLAENGTSTLELPNSVVMPELSMAAAEKEVSRLTTLDFFFNLFQTDRSEPFAIIETLEPVLDPESTADTTLDDSDTVSSADKIDRTPAVLKEMWRFLKTGSTSLRLFLWQRLRDAYQSINYNTKVFSCHLKCIEVIVADLRSDDYVDSTIEARQHKLLKWLKTLDDLLVKSLTIALNDAATCFEIIDERHLKSTCASLAQLSRILHAAALFDDEVRVGMRFLPNGPAFVSGGTFGGFTNKLREMQVRTWSLQYTLLKEAMTQDLGVSTSPENDLADYLALVHYSLGLRKSCRSSNKIFLKMMKVEMLRFKNIDRWEDYVGQVLFDLYGLKLGVGTYLLDDHGCPTENIDRRTVLNIMPHIIKLAHQIPYKDLIKHDLKTTIEKMQVAVGASKDTAHMTHNLRNYTEYLKTSLRPADFNKAWKGQLTVDTVPVLTAESQVAQQGWYFLLGMINLAKFKSQKRTNFGTPIDDLQVAAVFLRMQLQFDASHWETWFRLAQCFDLEIEEEILWSTDKLNNHMNEIIKLQRAAIHCYLMAVSTAMQHADDTPETATKLSELYFDFGMRMYASSREPFSMQAFYVDDFEKHMSGAQGMYKMLLHNEMRRYMVFSNAAKLFRRSLLDQPNKWMTHFMLGKCLWKMYRLGGDDQDPRARASKPTIDAVLKEFLLAIDRCPKPRDGRQEPIIEPHYKLVSIVNKAVLNYVAISPQDGATLLQRQQYSMNKGAKVTITNLEEWEEFILNHLKILRGVDKQHWQHRMVARVAAILYDDSQPNPAQAAAARTEFQNSVFTKTMQIVVWKPDAERPGRHCVYMERYVKQMMRLLWMTNDKENMELLIKRVRKKPNEFFRFATLWTECCTTYCRIVRRAFDIQASMEEVFKTVLPDDFEVLTDRVMSWAANPSSSHPALHALREAVELKKLNANLMKSTIIDDLINDSYATAYVHIQKTSGPIPPHVTPQLDSESAAARALGPMSLNNLVMDMNGTQIPVPVTVAAADTSSKRRYGISRREILKQAETLANRGVDPVRPARPTADSNLSVGSNAGQARTESGSAVGGVSRRGSEQEGVEDRNEEVDGEGDGGDVERREFDDDADDESDLSDVEGMEDVDESTIFA